MSDNNSLQNLLDSSTTEPTQLNPVTNLPIKPNTPNVMKGATSVKGLIDGVYLDPARDESYFSNPIQNDDPYDMKRVDWPVYDRKEIDHIRNASQTHGGRFLAFLNRAVAEIGGGTLYGLGALGDLAINGFESDYENFLTKMGDNWMDWARDVSPIFRETPGKGWDPGDPAWWAENSVSLVSTLSLLIPAAGTVRAFGLAGRGIGMLGKGMRTSARLGKLGKNSFIKANKINIDDSVIIGDNVEIVCDEISIGFNSYVGDNIKINCK